MTKKRFEMVTVEDPLWEYGTHLKEVLQDNLTGKQYRAVSRLVNLLNELAEENEELKRKLEYCEHEHFLDSLGSSNKWFGMGGF